MSGTANKSNKADIFAERHRIVIKSLKSISKCSRCSGSNDDDEVLNLHNHIDELVKHRCHRA